MTLVLLLRKDLVAASLLFAYFIFSVVVSVAAFQVFTFWKLSIVVLAVTAVMITRNLENIWRKNEETGELPSEKKTPLGNLGL